MDTVFLKIKQAFAQFMPPKILHTDNGAEFKNKLIKSYWEGKGINFVNGTPGHPQSQGVIEASNKTVKNFLILAKDAQKDKFNLEHSIVDFLMYYNQRKNTTKHSPIVIMNNVKWEIVRWSKRKYETIKETFKKWEHYLLKKEENTYQQLNKDRRQELLYLFIFEAHNQKQIFCKTELVHKRKSDRRKRITAK